MKIVIISAAWCNACLFMKKTYKQFQTNHPEMPFEMLDLDLDDEVSNYRIDSVLPIVLFLVDNKEIGRIEGECDLKQLERGYNDAFEA